MTNNAKKALFLIGAMLLTAAPVYSAASALQLLKPRKGKSAARKPHKPVDPSLVAAALAEVIKFPQGRQIIIGYYGYIVDDAGVISLSKHSPRDGFANPDVADLVGMYKIEHLQLNANGGELVVTTPPQSLASRRAGVVHRVTHQLDKNLRIVSTRDQRQLGSKLPARRSPLFGKRNKKKHNGKSPVQGALSDDETLLATWDPSESSLVHLSTVKPILSPRLARLAGFEL